MREFRITFTREQGVNVEAETEAEAREIVKNKDWEYGMEWDNHNIEILDVEELP